jgi:hypothetical protein
MVLAACGADTATPGTTVLPTSPTPTATLSIPPTTTPNVIFTVTPISTATPASTATSSSQPQTLQQTNWSEVLKKDPNLQVTNDNNTAQPYISIKGAEGGGGYPLQDAIVYLDLDGDNNVEAVIPLMSGGTAGVTAFLVYRSATDSSTGGPQFVTGGIGYKLQLTAQNGQLLAISALYSQGVPNCCPNAYDLVTYSLKGNKLVTVSERVEGVAEYMEETVSHYYTLLNSRRFEEAYQLLSPTYRAANPYQKWVAGYANTRKVEAKVSAVGRPNLVQIDLTSQDATTGGGVITRHWQGTWLLQWQQATSVWLLHEASISEVVSTGVVLDSFKSVTAALFKGTSLAVLLPTYLPEADSGKQVFASLTSVEAKYYSIELSLAPNCQGASACHLGSVEAAGGTSISTIPLSGKSLKLSKGQTAYFEEGQCGASCADSYLTWEQGGVRYRVGIKAGRQETLLRMANSAIDNGIIPRQ